MRKTKYTKELLEENVKNCYSVSQLVRNLGLRNTGGNYRNITNKLHFWNIDTTHFKGQGWSKDLKAENNKSLQEIRKKNSFSDEEVFCENSRCSYNGSVVKRLLKKGWEYKCKICNLSEWQNKKIALHLDHINGIGNDNRLFNLRFLCPNCHQQTETWGRGNINMKYLKKSYVKQNKCRDCGENISYKAARCKKCSSFYKKNNKINWPSVDFLEQHLLSRSCLSVARELGVSDNALRKHLRNHKDRKTMPL